MYKKAFLKREKAKYNTVLRAEMKAMPTISSSEMGPILRISRFDVITASGPEKCNFQKFYGF